MGGLEASWSPSAISSCYCNASSPQRHDPTRLSLWIARSHPSETGGGPVPDPTIWSKPARRAWKVGSGTAGSPSAALPTLVPALSGAWVKVELCESRVWRRVMERLRAGLAGPP